MKNIIFLAMYSNSFIYEINAAIQSLMPHISSDKEQYRIIVYTDRPEAVCLGEGDRLPIVLRMIDPNRAREWLGDKRYRYRVKLLALIAFLEEFKQSAMLIDSDTLFLSSPDSLFQIINDTNSVVMNYEENRLGDFRATQSSVHRNSNEYRMAHELLAHGGFQRNGTTYTLSPETKLWNSGVIGISYKGLDYLRETLDLCDYLFARYQIRTTEQIALSLVLGQHYEIKRSDDVVFHYWFMKEARLLIESVLGMPSRVEPQYAGTWIQDEVRSLTDTTLVNDLSEAIVRLTRKKRKHNYFGILQVVGPECRTGKLLRSI